MKTILYSCPYVPAEWIAAHALRPSRIVPRLGGEAHAGAARWNGSGLCLLVRAWLGEAARRREESGLAAIVLSTTCDQMRRAAELVERVADVPVFLMNIPSTWQTVAAQNLYGEELKRLGRFLVTLGGQRPSAETLARVMLEFDEARAALRAARGRLSPKDFARALAEFQAAGSPDWRPGGERLKCEPPSLMEPLPQANSVDCSPGRDDSPSAQDFSPGKSTVWPASPVGTTELNTGHHPIPLALVGEALLEQQMEIFDLIEQAGGRIDLDASAMGERTLPAPLDRRALKDDPLAALAEAYFGSIPDAMRRPNSALYQWLKINMAERGIRGIVFRRSLWCDLWNAEAQRMKEWALAPLLALDLSDEERPNGSTVSRIGSFLEMLA